MLLIGLVSFTHFGVHMSQVSLPPSLSRRRLLVGAAATAGAFGLGGASRSALAQPTLPALRNGELLDVPDFSKLAASPYRVGIRPHRRKGVCLKVDPEPMRTARGTPKFLVHNYGHGGAGITLSFGCAEVVREHVANLIERDLKRPARNIRVVVVGAGVIGLTTAAELKRWRPELDVRVMAKTIGPNRQVNVEQTTSWVAGGQFEPSGIWREFGGPRPGDELDDEPRPPLEVVHDYIRRSANRIKALQRAGTQRAYGIVDRNNYTLQDYDGRQMPTMEGGFDSGTPPDVIPAPALGTLPFAPLRHVAGREYQTWLINPTILLKKLVADLRQAGARFESRDLQTEAELRAIDADIIVNCTGLGSKTLLNDTKMVPISGQLVILKNPNKLKYMFSGGCGSAVAYLFARQDDIVVGGTYDENIDTPVIDELRCDTFLEQMRQVFCGNVVPCGLTSSATQCPVPVTRL